METLVCIRTGSLLSVTLKRPEVRNAFNDTMVRELSDVFRGEALDPGVRVVLVQGEGPVFCAGADLGWMKRAAASTRDENQRDARAMAGMFRAFAEIPCATIACVRGAALGGGSGLVACADIVLAEDAAKFGFTEVRLGIIPSVISSFVLRKIGRSAAHRYFLTGEIFSAKRACELGLISEAVPAGGLDAALDDIIKTLKAVGPTATRAAKRLIGRVLETPYPRVLDECAEWIAELRDTPEAREGMSAFLEKRPPAWMEPSA